MTLLKLCGTTSVEDARLAGRACADFCGILVDVEWSERSLTLPQARDVAAASGLRNVILLCNPSAAFAKEVAVTLRPYAQQLLCQEPPSLVAELKSSLTCAIWKTVHLPLVEGQATPQAYESSGADTLLVDSVDASDGFIRLGGTGKIGDWAAVASLREKLDIPIFLAGGIGPQNVADAVRTVQPDGIDLCSGVEVTRGRRDPAKVERLMRKFRQAVGRHDGTGRLGRSEAGKEGSGGKEIRRHS